MKIHVLGHSKDYLNKKKDILKTNLLQHPLSAKKHKAPTALRIFHFLWEMA